LNIRSSIFTILLLTFKSVTNAPNFVTISITAFHDGNIIKKGYGLARTDMEIRKCLALSISLQTIRVTGCWAPREAASSFRLPLGRGAETTPPRRGGEMLVQNTTTTASPLQQHHHHHKLIAKRVDVSRMFYFLA